jgi:hypothetical protein
MNSEDHREQVPGETGGLPLMKLPERFRGIAPTSTSSDGVTLFKANWVDEEGECTLSGLTLVQVLALSRLPARK